MGFIFTYCILISFFYFILLTVEKTWLMCLVPEYSCKSFLSIFFASGHSSQRDCAGLLIAPDMTILIAVIVLFVYQNVSFVFYTSLVNLFLKCLHCSCSLITFNISQLKKNIILIHTAVYELNKFNSFESLISWSVCSCTVLFNFFSRTTDQVATTRIAT